MVLRALTNRPLEQLAALSLLVERGPNPSGLFDIVRLRDVAPADALALLEERRIRPYDHGPRAGRVGPNENPILHGGERSRRPGGG